MPDHVIFFRRFVAIVWESIWQSCHVNFQDNQPSKPILILRLYHIAAAKSEVHFLQTGLCVDGDRGQYGTTRMLDHVIFQQVWGHGLVMGWAATPMKLPKESAQQANFNSEAISYRTNRFRLMFKASAATRELGQPC